MQTIEKGFEVLAVVVSTSLASTIREHTGAAEAADGFNAFVETALRRSYREGWDERHENATYERIKRLTGEEMNSGHRELARMILQRAIKDLTALESS